MDTPAEGAVYRFGAFELDARRRRLMKDGQLCPLPDRQFDVLQTLCAAGGNLVSKNELADVCWQGIAVSDNNIDKAISNLRRLIGNTADGLPGIESRKRVGVRIVVPVRRLKDNRPAKSIDGVLEPFLAFGDGRSALETLDLDALSHAHQAFLHAIRLDPDNPAGHVGLANTFLLTFESTRADTNPDRKALDAAFTHASEACRLNVVSAEAWSTLACVCHERGDAKNAVAASRRAVALAPQNWLHHLRLAHVSWGSERLDAVREVLSIYPEAPLGHRFAATVLVARRAFDRARAHLRAGCAAQDAQANGSGRFSAIGLHLLHGLVLAAEGDVKTAREEFARELALDNPDHIFARECGANTWCAIGALALRENRELEACKAFREALSLMRGHAMATVALQSIETRQLDMSRIPTLHSSVDSAIVRAAAFALQDRHAEAAATCLAALHHAEPGSAGYLIPVEPLLGATRHPHLWREVFSTVAARAS
jgi:DNA-binding winged helix-turn-helix (wHTH) protein